MDKPLLSIVHLLRGSAVRVPARLEGSLALYLSLLVRTVEVGHTQGEN